MLDLPLTASPEGFAVLGGLPHFDQSRATELVFCQECRSWHSPDEDWRCPTCGKLAAYATQPHRCELCQRDGLAARAGHRVMSLCLCHETPEARRIRLRDEAKAEHEAAVERQRAQLARERLAAERKLKGEAAACWAAKGQRCNEKADLYESCRVCVRWRNSKREEQTQ